MSSERKENKTKQGNRGDMRKINVACQFFESTGLQGHFVEKTKNWFQVWSGEFFLPNFRCLSFFRMARGDTYADKLKWGHMNLYITKYKNKPRFRHADFNKKLS